MKKSIFSRLMMPIFLFILIVTTNCGQKDTLKQNDETTQEVLPSKALTKVDDYNSLTFDQIRLFSMEVQKYCFNQMNSNNKARIWMERISYISSLYKNSIKKTKILELKTLISPELYSTGQRGNFQITLNKWVDNNKVLLGPENIRLILTTMSELRIRDTKDENLSEVMYTAILCPPKCGPSNPCTCSSSSNYCSGNTTVCLTGGCDVSSWGCGDFLAYSCNGKCSVW